MTTKEKIRLLKICRKETLEALSEDNAQDGLCWILQCNSEEFCSYYESHKLDAALVSAFGTAFGVVAEAQYQEHPLTHFFGFRETQFSKSGLDNNYWWPKNGRERLNAVNRRIKALQKQK